MKPEAGKYIKLLRLEAKAPDTSKAAKTYPTHAIRAANYRGGSAKMCQPSR
jgi:hypothetical protein